MFCKILAQYSESKQKFVLGVHDKNEFHVQPQTKKCSNQEFKNEILASKNLPQDTRIYFIHHTVRNQSKINDFSVSF